MNEELIETQSLPKTKDRIIQFYKKNKIYVFSILFLIIIIIAFLVFHLEKKEKDKVFLTDNYVKAKIYLSNNNKEEAKNILKNIIFSDDATYSILSLFLILDENLITDQQELSNLFDHILKNDEYEKEIKDLIVLKKAVFQSNFLDEVKLLDITKSLIKDNSLWKPHALLLLGDYFVSKREYLKAKEFYLEILTVKNLYKEFYDEAKSRLTLIPNE